MSGGRGGSASADLTGLLVTQNGTVELPAALRYAAEDPWAVRLVLLPGEAEWAAQWAFARNVLAAGMRFPAGDGDVRVRPSDTAGWLEVALYSPAGSMRLLLPAAKVGAFLRLAFESVPAGAEGEQGDADAEIRGLLDGP